LRLKGKAQQTLNTSCFIHSYISVVFAVVFFFVLLVQCLFAHTNFRRFVYFSRIYTTSELLLSLLLPSLLLYYIMSRTHAVNVPVSLASRVRKTIFVRRSKIILAEMHMTIVATVVMPSSPTHDRLTVLHTSFARTHTHIIYVVCVSYGWRVCNITWAGGTRY